jgi:tetratricopeptide (TPR) repeat protein
MSNPSSTASNVGSHNLNTVVLQGVSVQGNVNITQITGRSAEYKEITDRIAELEEMLSVIPETNVEKRQSYLEKLEAARKQERDFRDGVLRLAATFDKITINTERLQAAKDHFDNGRLREASAILDAEALGSDQDKLLDARQRKEQELKALDEQLQNNADEWLVKAQITAMQYDLPGWAGLAVSYFDKSLRARETLRNVTEYAGFLSNQNDFQPAIALYEKALVMADTQKKTSLLSRTAWAIFLPKSIPLGKRKMPSGKRWKYTSHWQRKTPTPGCPSWQER